jgi:hypothetical protein
MRWTPLLKEYQGVDFYINSMLEHDARIYAYEWHLVCLHALNFLFVLYYQHIYIYERGISNETMISGPVFNHKKFSSYFYDV